MSPLTITFGTTTHEEAEGRRTACGKKIGPPRDGWRHPLTPGGFSYPVNCAACIDARAEAGMDAR